MESLCVIGLGYIGLPTASLFANNGFAVIGVDTSPAIVDLINSGKNHIEEVGLRTLVEAAVASARLKASTVATTSDVFIIAVPTPFLADKKPDLRHVFEALASIIPLLQPGNLVILESTVPPGTTRSLAETIARERPDLLADHRNSPGSLRVLIAHCPERVLPGRILKELVENDRVVGGATPEAGRAASRLYARIVSGTIHQTDATTAEMVKLSENTFRDVNIALANELAVVCERLGIDVRDVLSLASKHPRVKFLSPGPGVGGHCIAVDPWFVVSAVPEETGLLRAARSRNDGMPARVVERVLELLKGCASPKVAILGASYKGNVGDPRNSPAIEIFQTLTQRLATKGSVMLHDPFVRDERLPLRPLTEVLAGASLVLVLSDHDEYHNLNSPDVAKLVSRKEVYDTRGVIDAAAWASAGFNVYLLGMTGKYGAHSD